MLLVRLTQVVAKYFVYLSLALLYLSNRIDSSFEGLGNVDSVARYLIAGTKYSTYTYTMLDVGSRLRRGYLVIGNVGSSSPSREASQDLVSSILRYLHGL